MNIDQDSYILGVWIVEMVKGNILHSIMRVGEDKGDETTWLVESRFRIYLDDRMLDSDDLKFFQQWNETGSEEAVRTGNDVWCRDCAAAGKASKVEFIPVYGNSAKLMPVLAKHPSFHTRPATPEEVALHTTKDEDVN